MELQIMCGYVRKVDLNTNQLLDVYSYPELLLHRSLRGRLKAEMAEQGEIRLFCACSGQNDRPVYLNDSLSIYFPKDCGHHADCVSYIAKLSEFLATPVIRALVAERPRLDAGFKWRKGSHAKWCIIRDYSIQNILEGSPSLTLADFVKLINLRVSYKICLDVSHGRRITYPDSEEMLHEIAFELGKLSLRDAENNTVSLTEQFLFHNYAQPKTISFLYAKILLVERGYRNKVYLTARHSNGTSFFTISHEKWDSLEPYIQFDLPLYICGFVRTTETSTYIRGKRDPVTHAYKTSQSTKKKIHEITSFCLFHAATNGMLCTTRKDFETITQLCSNASFFCIPYFPETPASLGTVMGEGQHLP